MDESGANKSAIDQIIEDKAILLMRQNARTTL
ncbi:hypothetical protein AAKU64_004343 [Undibacterium sp. GrIS 1.8]